MLWVGGGREALEAGRRSGMGNPDAHLSDRPSGRDVPFRKGIGKCTLRRVARLAEISCAPASGACRVPRDGGRSKKVWLGGAAARRAPLRIPARRSAPSRCHALAVRTRGWRVRHTIAWGHCGTRSPRVDGRGQKFHKNKTPSARAHPLLSVPLRVRCEGRGRGGALVFLARFGSADLEVYNLLLGDDRERRQDCRGPRRCPQTAGGSAAPNTLSLIMGGPTTTRRASAWAERAVNDTQTADPVWSRVRRESYVRGGSRRVPSPVLPHEGAEASGAREPLVPIRTRPVTGPTPCCRHWGGYREGMQRVDRRS